MYTGRLIFSQLMDHLPMPTFRRCVERYQGDRWVKSFRCVEHYRCMAFAQLTYRESLRDIEACLRAQGAKLYPWASRGDRVRAAPWPMPTNNAIGASTPTSPQRLIHTAQPPLCGNDALALDLLDETVYALDSSTIDLCLTLFPWVDFRKTKACTHLLDLRGSIPAFIHISTGKLHDVNVIDLLMPEAGAFVRHGPGLRGLRPAPHPAPGARLLRRARQINTQLRRLYSHPVDRSAGVICDQTIVLTGVTTPDSYPDKLRRIKVRDAERGKTLVFLTNNWALPASTIAELYRCRWQVELFFKWIKQHLRIKSFYGTSENAVRTQIWIAVSVYVLVAIIKKRLNLDLSLYTILQILSITVFERLPINQVLTDTEYRPHGMVSHNQLNLFDD